MLSNLADGHQMIISWLIPERFVQIWSFLSDFCNLDILMLIFGLGWEAFGPVFSKLKIFLESLLSAI